MMPLKKALKNIDKCFVTDRITEEDVIKRGDELYTKVEKLRQLESTLERIALCKTAGDVFGEFAIDAAIAKVEEMLNGRSSQIRQRAQETVLDYALGKPIQRNMSVGISLSDSREEEIEGDIRSLLVDLGFQSRKGTATSIFMGPKRDPGQVEVIELQAEPRFSGKLHKEHEDAKANPHREPRGEDDDISV